MKWNFQKEERDCLSLPPFTKTSWVWWWTSIDERTHFQSYIASALTEFLQYRARTSSRTDVQRKPFADGSSFLHLFLQFPIKLAMAAYLLCSQVYHWSCTCPITFTEVTNCKTGFACYCILCRASRVLSFQQTGEQGSHRSPGVSLLSAKAQMLDKSDYLSAEELSMMSEQKCKCQGKISNVYWKTKSGSSLISWNLSRV